jgi:L-amino acid N-acyltransferase YncA
MWRRFDREGGQLARSSETSAVRGQVVDSSGHFAGDTDMTTEIEIRAACESDAESIREALKAIASEKRYLTTVDGFSLEETRSFLKHLSDAGLPQMIAAAESKVVGFCDISPNPELGFTHIARLGMGVRSEWRRRGLAAACWMHA